MMCELLKIKKIIETAGYDKRNLPNNRESLICRPLENILDDFIEMHATLWDITRVIDNMERGE